MNRNSQIILVSDMKLDKEYKNVLTYTEQQMLALCQQKQVVSANNYSFLKPDENVICVGWNYATCLKADYIAFQNPYYSNKWFFAFIDRVEYISEKSCNIHYTIDEFSTWYSYWSPNACFVLREHVNDDIVGLHTMPENVETGEYFCNAYYVDPDMQTAISDMVFVVASTSIPISGEIKETTAPSAIYNGLYTGLTYYRYSNTGTIDLLLEIFANSGKTEAINGIFMAPGWLAQDSGDLYHSVLQSNSPYERTITVTKQTTLNGYTPKNKKLLTFPYNYLVVSNNIGQNNILAYEKFSISNICNFLVRGVLSPGCSVSIIPRDYNGIDKNENESIQLGKFPICNFQNDMYTNWLTQNSINVLGQTISTDDLSLGVATAQLAVNPIEGGISLFNAMLEKKRHNMIPPTISGQLNSADVNVAADLNNFHFYKMSVKKEFAESIDNYFSRVGYAVNITKVPNITGRQNFNYVQIASTENIGYSDKQISVPASSMEIIDNIFRTGTTLWHNYNNLGNYNVSNESV